MGHSLALCGKRYLRAKQSPVASPLLRRNPATVPPERRPVAHPPTQLPAANPPPTAGPAAAASATAGDLDPGVSIVIANRNQGHFLRDSVDSALAEKGVEVLVVDDASSDDSLQILSRYGRQIRVLHGPGRGACTARNIGLEACATRYVKFLDADDYLLPGALTEQHRYLDALPETRVSVFGDVLWVDEAGCRSCSLRALRRASRRGNRLCCTLR